MSYAAKNWAATTAEPPPEPAAIRWEETRCLLCGSPHWHLLLEAPDHQGGTGLWFAVVQCDECGLCFTNPRPAPDQLAPFYPDDYRPHHTTDQPAKAGWRRWLTKFRRPRPPLAWHGRGRLLDFGCGGGAFLLQMQAAGWDVTGLDVSTATVLRLRAEKGLHVLAGTLPHPELRPGSFDVVTMWHALEHVPEPRAILREANRLLDHGGRLVVAVPNIDSLAYRVFGRNWFGLDVPRHLTHFTPWTLRLMLERSGFTVLSLRTVRHSAWLRHSARLARRGGAADWFQRGLQTHWLSRLAAAYGSLTHQADALLAVATPAPAL